MVMQQVLVIVRLFYILKLLKVMLLERISWYDLR